MSNERWNCIPQQYQFAPGATPQQCRLQRLDQDAKMLEDALERTSKNPEGVEFITRKTTAIVLRMLVEPAVAMRIETPT